MKPPFPALPMGRADRSDRWKPQQVPGATMRRFAISLFLTSLAVLFIATLVAYVFIRLTGPAGAVTAPASLPGGLWASTAVLLLCGVFVAFSQRAARAARVDHLRVALPLTWVASVAFLAIQAPSVWQLAQAHRPALEAHGHAGPYGLLLTLIVLHAIHIVGGLVPLTLLVHRVFGGPITPATLGGIRSCATYWHFLEGVWIVMFGTFLLIG